MAQKALHWMPLDNAAKIYPAARRKNWSNIFRLSATLTEPVDKTVLRSALAVTAKRFPYLAVRVRRGVFWYYLQQVAKSPEIREEGSCPLLPMPWKEVRKCALRVIAYENRIAVEIFHSLTDGNGGLIFLKSLVAEYLEQKYAIAIPAEQGVFNRWEAPRPEEMEDSFLKYAGPVRASRRENTAWHLKGTIEPEGFRHVTCFRLPVAAVLEKARSYGVSATAFLTAAMMMALQNWQKERIPQRRRKPIKVLIPVNLRKLFPSRTLRNFVLYTTPEILPQLGEYEFSELCRVVSSKMAADILPKPMSRMIATNVASEQVTLLRLMPLFVKNGVMKAVFDTVGERKSCLSLSNLGQVQLPQEMMPYVERLDFILGVQATAPYNCGVLSYGENMYLNFIRNIKEPFLERHFYEVLRGQGLPVQVQSNG